MRWGDILGLEPRVDENFVGSVRPVQEELRHQHVQDADLDPEPVQGVKGQLVEAVFELLCPIL